MKFLALSSLLGLAFLSQQTESYIVFDDFMNQKSNPTVTSNLQVRAPYYNQGVKTLFNSFNLLGNSQPTPNNNFNTNINTLSNSGLNLNTQPEESSQRSYQQTSSSSKLDNQRKPRNPLDALNKNTWGIFDDNKIFCKSPRIWDGIRCKCSGNGYYVSGKCYSETPQQSKKDNLLSLRFINRNFDGTEVNPKNPKWGSKQIPLQRLCSPNYADGKSQMWPNQPGPRFISNLVGQLEGQIIQSKLGLNMLFTIYGQFLDHDITLTPTTADQKMNIQIPRCDQWMDKKCTGKQQFKVTRSIYDKNSEVRKNMNVITAWIDGSQIYGSDKQTNDGLRQFKNGKLKTSNGNLLPKDQTGSFLAGDVRVNQNVGLTCFQTVFLRQHNRICDLVLQKNPYLSDEQVFHIARNYVIGLLQHITFDQYLPALLGKYNYDNLIGQYRYDQKANPNIYTQFSAAAFRLGHPLINSPFKLIDNNGKLIKQLTLGEMFFNPNIVDNQSLNQFLNGLGRTGAKQRSLQLVNDLRNFLFFPPNSQVKIDLFSFNVQRGRDHGICSAEDARQKMGLSKKDFKDLFQDKYKAECLQNIYQDTDNLDLWVNIIGQKSEKGSVLGELGIKLNAFQFKNIRNGDRFWYQNSYPDSIIRQIKNTSFTDVIKRNTGVKYLNSQTFKKA